MSDLGPQKLPAGERQLNAQRKRTTTDVCEYIESQMAADPDLRRRVAEATAELERETAEYQSLRQAVRDFINKKIDGMDDAAAYDMASSVCHELSEQYHVLWMELIEDDADEDDLDDSNSVPSIGSSDE